MSSLARRTVAMVMAAGIVSAGLLPGQKQTSAAQLAVEPVGNRLRDRLDSSGNAPRLRVGEVPIRTAATLASFYRNRAYRPAWMDTDGISPRAADLVRALREAGTEGLRPEDYHLAEIQERLTLAARAGASGEEAYTDLDLLLSDALFLYASHLAAGYVDPAAVDTLWEADRTNVALTALLGRAVQRGTITRTLDSLRPTNPAYEGLKNALQTYRALEARGGWAPVSGDETLEHGDRDGRIRLLRARLAATGDLDLNDATDLALFDDGLQTAVEHFQSRHGLVVDGIVGPATLAALNTPVEERVQQIVANLERWRWLPRTLGPRYIMVNIPAFELEVVEQNRQVLRMRAIVGRTDRRTPVLSESMTHLVLNPYWNVPYSIASEDILPQIKENPDYLATQKMRLLREVNGETEEIDPETVEWSGVTETNFPFRIRQDPGADNALGRVKFIFPNRFSVFIHDTPGRALFDRSVRNLSSGCVRIEKPLELASYLLKTDARWDADALTTALSTASDRTVSLPEPIPVHVLYLTAWVDGNSVQFRRDLYGLDAALGAALAETPPTFRSPDASDEVPATGGTRVAGGCPSGP